MHLETKRRIVLPPRESYGGQHSEYNKLRVAAAVMACAQIESAGEAYHLAEDLIEAIDDALRDIRDREHE